MKFTASHWGSYRITEAGLESVEQDKAPVDLSRICAAPSARLSHFSFEGNRALPAQC